MDSSDYSISDFPNLKSFSMKCRPKVKSLQYIERWLLRISELENLNTLNINSNLILKDLGNVSELNIVLISSIDEGVPILDSMETNMIKKLEITVNHTYLSNQLAVDINRLDSLERLKIYSSHIKELFYSYSKNQIKFKKILLIGDSLELVTADGPPIDLEGVYVISKTMSNLECLHINISDLSTLEVFAPIEAFENSSLLNGKSLNYISFEDSKLTSIPSQIFDLKNLEFFSGYFTSLDIDALETHSLPKLSTFYVTIDPNDYSLTEISKDENGVRKMRLKSRKLAKKLSFKDAVVVKAKKIKKNE